MNSIIAFLVVIGSQSHAAPVDPWVKIIKDNAKAVSTVEITNIPPVMSQDSLGICYAYAVATVLNAANCKYGLTSSAPKSIDCKNLSEKEMISPLALARYAGGYKDFGGNDSDYDTLKIDGAKPGYLLDVAINLRGFVPSEDCASLSRILDKIAGDKKEKERAEQTIWDSLRNSFNASKKKDCPKCKSDAYTSAKENADQLNLDSDVSGKLDDFFSQKVYEKALNELIYPSKCSDQKYSVKIPANDNAPIEPVGFPKKTATVEQLMKTIKDVIGTQEKPGSPLVLTFCGGENPSEKCETPKGKTEGHAVVIAGYRKLCGADGKSNCREEVKVINSYGKSWQTENNEGWMDAKWLLSRATYYPNSLVWVKGP